MKDRDKHGGFTYQPFTPNTPEKGMVPSTFPVQENIFPAGRLTAQEVNAYKSPGGEAGQAAQAGGVL